MRCNGYGMFHGTCENEKELEKNEYCSRCIKLHEEQCEEEINRIGQILEIKKIITEIEEEDNGKSNIW